VSGTHFFYEELIMRSECPASRIVFIALFLLAGEIAGFAQNGNLQFHVTPKQAYIFVDDRAVSEASKHPSLSLSAGEHKVELVNYGYQPVTRTVTITAGETTNLEVALEDRPGSLKSESALLASEKQAGWTSL
jgi:PEGA domain